MKKTQVLAWIGVLGFAVYLLQAKFGLQILNPMHTNWMMVQCSDGLVGYNGWEHFKDQPWTFPLGLLKDYEYPVTTTIGLTDTTPIMAILFKLLRPLFGATPYHFFGIWIAISFLLQGIFGFKLLEALKIENPIFLLLGTCFFLLSPPFLHRFVHPSLAMHWAILASFWLYFESSFTVSQRLKRQYILTAIMAWTHPYAAAMITGLTLTLIFKIWLVDRKLKWGKALLHMLFTVALVAGLWAIMGYFSTKASLQNDSFGIYSANWNTLFNSAGRTQLLPALPLAIGRQSEGFGYLGLGILVLLIFGSLNIANVSFKRKYLPLLIFIILATGYAVSDKWTFNEHTFLQLSYPSFLTQQLRSSGRFIWILHYALVLLGLVLLLKSKWADGVKYAVLGSLLLIQFIDIQPLIARTVKHDGSNLQYNKALWSPAVEACERIITYPPFVWDFVELCDQGKITHIAADFDKPVTCGRTVYSNNKKKRTFRKYLNAQLDSFALAAEQQSLFISSEKYLNKFIPALEANTVKGFRWGDYLVYIPTTLYDTHPNLQAAYPSPLNDSLLRFRPESLTDFIQARSQYTLLLSVKDEARSRLDENFYKMMESKGSAIRNIAFRGSYAAILQDSVVAEQMRENEQVQIQQQNIQILSAGMNAGNESSILVDGEEYSPSKRGFNIVVLSNEGRVIERVVYDTYNSLYKRTIIEVPAEQ